MQWSKYEDMFTVCKAVMTCLPLSVAGAYEEKLMRYVVSMNKRMMQIQSDVKRLNTRVWGGGGANGIAPTMRSQIPCGSIEQLRLLEEELMESSAAYNDLVSNCDITSHTACIMKEMALILYVSG